MEGMHKPATTRALQFALNIFVRFNPVSVMCATYQRYRRNIKLLLKTGEIAFRVRRERDPVPVFLSGSLYNSGRSLGRGTCQLRSDAIRQLVSMREQEADLPCLRIRQGTAKTGHARKTDAVNHLPISLTRFVVGYALALQEFRRLGEHATRDRGLRLPGQSMTNCTVVLVNLGAGQVVWLIGG